MSNSSFVNQINSIRQIIPAYYLPPVFFLGVIGNSLNIIIFARTRLRTNVGSWYFICLSISQIALLLSNCLSRIISYGWSPGYDIGGLVSAVCKLRVYVFVVSLILSRHFLCLITIDRWMKTSRSAWLRQKSSPKYAKWIIILSFIFWTIFSVHILIGFQSVSNVCIAPSQTYFSFYLIYNTIVGIVPFFIMISFCFLLLKTVRKRRRNVIPVSVLSQQARQQSRTDFQLVRLSLLQSFAYLIFNSIISGFSVYNLITTNWMKSIEQKAIESLVNDTSFYLVHTYISVSTNLFFYRHISNCLF